MQIDEPRAAQRAADRARCTSQGEDVDLRITLGEQRQWVGGQRAQHPELRDLHEPRLARHRGLDLLQPAALPLRQPRQGHPPGVRRRARRERERRGERARAHRDDRHRGRRPGRRVLAHRPALLADHPLHGRDALRRERRRPASATPTSRSARSYHDCYDGDPAAVSTPSEWERLGFNESSVHTDIVSTTDRVVTATLRDGERARDLRDGEFQLDDDN